MQSLKPAIEKLIGRFGTAQPLGGGDISRSWKITLEGGASFFLKVQSAALKEMYEAELVGLNHLRSRTGFRIPRVWDVVSSATESGLLMEWIQSSHPDEISWRKFWENLSELHSVREAQFGLAMDNYIGSLKQRNDPQEDWVEFWIERRISDKLAHAVERSAVKQEDIPWFLRLFEAVRARFRETPFEPRLLHGDLWKGNVFFDMNGDPVLVDPAIYYGPPEMDLAFMDLFGGFSDVGKDRYAPKGFESFLGDDFYPVWQVYPLLIHTILFGGMYRRRLLTCVETCLQLL